MAAEVVHCPHADDCGGCDFIGRPLSWQRDHKISELGSLLRAGGVSFPAIDFISPALNGLRDRLDFVLEEGRLGLAGKSRREAGENPPGPAFGAGLAAPKERPDFSGGTGSRIVDLLECGQLSASLGAWLEEFRAHLPRVRRGSVRLRVAPDGRRGMWLDFSNADIKNLLDESAWLKSWPADVVIEMGQRRKWVDRGPSRPVLRDPVLFPWFESRFQEEVVPLYGMVGSFTQPGLRSNRLITEWIQSEVRRRNPRHIVEFGSGQGNLSFPALSGGATLTACETDRLALQGFARSLEALAEKGHDLRAKVRIEAGDFLRRPPEDFLSADLLLVNPPRSGLKKFLDPLPQARGLESILSMSCHPESFAEDAPRMVREGFALKKLRILDQFPQTKHYEVLAVFER
ncbi:MAG: RNA methyltransferase [Bdellovibrionaceae bacterium]|nr:RNA methyltransferase [Pseudobdellovibrionaceae bacterium]